jgi:hypothetical protein
MLSERTRLPWDDGVVVLAQRHDDVAQQRLRRNGLHKLRNTSDYNVSITQDNIPERLYSTALGRISRCPSLTRKEAFWMKGMSLAITYLSDSLRSMVPAGVAAITALCGLNMFMAGNMLESLEETLRVFMQQH